MGHGERKATAPPQGRERVRSVFQLSVVSTCVLVVLVQAVLLIWFVRTGTALRPSAVPVAVVAPAVVSDPIADQIDAIDERPLQAVPLTDRDTARADVRSGRLIAAIEVDLRSTRDTLLVNTGTDRRLRAAVVDQIRAFQAGSGRTVEIREVSGSASGSESGDGRLIGIGATVLGLVLALVITLGFGWSARNARLGVVRVLSTMTLSMLIGFVLTHLPGVSLGGDPWLLSLIAGLSMLTSATLLYATVGLLGWVGVGVVLTGYIFVGMPYLLAIDPWLLLDGWRGFVAATPPGATHDAMTAVVVYDGRGVLRPLVVLWLWFVTGTLMLLASRFLRARREPDAPTELPGVPWLVVWRLRVAGLAIPLIVVLVVVMLLTPGSGPAPAAVARTASTTQCLSTGEVRSVADLNRISGGIEGSEYFRGGDVGASASLQDGRRLWFFGDTLRGDGSFVRNSMLVFERRCMAVVLPPSEGAVIPGRGDQGYWPMSVAVQRFPGYDLVAVSAQRVEATGSGSFDFRNTGPAIAAFIVRRGQTPQFLGVQDVGPASEDRSQPMWGAAVTVRDGWVYLYGTANDGTSFGYSVRVARTRISDLLDVDGWRYWNGSAWGSDPDEAVELIDGDGGVSQTFSVFSRGSTWYAVSKRDEFVGRDLVVWTAPGPTGPFTAHSPAASIGSSQDGALKYMPLAHPELLPRRGSVVVSYSRNRTDTSQVQRNPLLYRPRFLRIPLPDAE